MPSLSLSEARAALVAAGVTGPHRSHDRVGNIAKIKALVERDPDATFGLSAMTGYGAAQVLGFLSELTGCSPDINDLDSQDAIDPDRTVSAIVAAAERLAELAASGAALLAVTGHPTGLLEHHMRVVDAYRRAGGTAVRLGEDERIRVRGKGRMRIRYNGSVGCLADGANLLHTHSAAPMEALLDGRPWPDVVLADHGFAGAAIERDIPTVAVMDINDPALAVAWAEKRNVGIIPMDDNRPPVSYEASWRIFEWVLAGAGA